MAEEQTQGKRRGRKRAVRPVEPKGHSDFPITNRQLAELLASEGEKSEGHKRKAFFRAAHTAFIWPEECATLLAEGRSLTEFPGVGPYLSKVISDWVKSPPEIPVAPALRKNFLTFAEASRILADNPDWRARLKGDLQMHSEWSDGSAAIADMAEAAIARGYEYLSITDHTKGLKIAGGINENDLERQWREIDSINSGFEKNGVNFRVLKSVEMNLSPDGSGDLDSDCLAQLDIVLGSFHSALRKTEDQTSRYIAALNNPDIQILGHPRGRVYNYRIGLTADWRTVFTEAARLDKAVEIDAYSDRQDLDVELLQIARDCGVRISFGSDAHHPWQLLFLDLALAASLLAGVPADRIINFMPVEDLLEWVSSVRQKRAGLLAAVH